MNNGKNVIMWGQECIRMSGPGLGWEGQGRLAGLGGHTQGHNIEKIIDSTGWVLAQGHSQGLVTTQGQAGQGQRNNTIMG